MVRKTPLFHSNHSLVVYSGSTGNMSSSDAWSKAKTSSSAWKRAARTRARHKQMWSLPTVVRHRESRRPGLRRRTSLQHIDCMRLRTLVVCFYFVLMNSKHGTHEQIKNFLSTINDSVHHHLHPEKQTNEQTNEEKDPHRERVDQTEHEETTRRRRCRSSRINPDKINCDYSYGLLS